MAIGPERDRPKRPPNTGQRIYRALLRTRFRYPTLALHHLLGEIRVFLVDLLPRRRLRRRLRGKRDLRIQIGCGPKPKEGWINLDLSTRADYRLDLRRPLPLADGAAREIYCEHFLEHLSYPEDTRRFLADCHRLLAPGGRLLLAVPDTESLLRAYRSPGETGFFNSEGMRYWHEEWCTTPLEHINFHFRQDGPERPPHHPEYHHYAFDFETLSHNLALTGFQEVTEREYDPELDSEERRHDSLRVVARRR